MKIVFKEETSGQKLVLLKANIKIILSFQQDEIDDFFE
jgi:hypothetical protein